MKYNLFFLLLLFSCTRETLSGSGTFSTPSVTVLATDEAKTSYIIPAIRYRVDGKTVYKHESRIFELPATFTFRKHVFTNQVYHYVFSDGKNVIVKAFSIDGREISCGNTVEIHEKLGMKRYGFCYVLNDVDIFTLVFSDSNDETKIPS
jgi:hypothetical protein